MKYIAIIDESQLNDFEKYHLLFEGKKRNLELKPICKEMLVNKDGESVYLSDGHIKCFLDYEQKKILEEVIYRNPIVGRVEKEDTAEQNDSKWDKLYLYLNDRRLAKAPDLPIYIELGHIMEVMTKIEKEKAEQTAEWVQQFPGSKLLKCSKCGYEYCDLLECTNYCGNCGAKMVESEEEE